MAELTLALFLIGVLIGGYMFSFTLGVGRPESTARVSSLPALLLFVHPVLALAALGVWIAYVSSDAHALTWVTLATLLVVSALGGVLVMRTVRHKRQHQRGAVPHALDPQHTSAETAVANRTVAEKQIPASAVVLHGLVALTLVALVLYQAVTG